MTPDQQLDFCLKWTDVTDHQKRLAALQKAYRWAVRRVFNSESGPNLLASIGEELTALASVTKTLDIESLLSHELLGFKKLWLKLPSDIKFVGMEKRDTNDEAFEDGDADPAASLTVAMGHPVVYDIINFGQARFAPALPIGAVIRVDYYRLARVPGQDDSGDVDSSEEADVPVVGEDLPAIFDDAITSEACSILWSKLDDDREMEWHQRALSELNDSLFIWKRVQGPTQTGRWKPQRKRYI